MDTLQQHIAFIIEVDKLKTVLRKTKTAHADRYENSAEHSWQIALFALNLRDFAAEPVDIDKVVRMLLIHDLGEIDTGDTLVYAEGGAAEREAEELAAMRRILGLLPQPMSGQLLALWQEFEARKSPEARFARAIDRLMPILLNLRSGGQSWRENGVSKEKVLAMAVGKVEDGCPLAANWLRAELERAEQAGYFGA
ncbi:HD family hydrolase [Chromobacterium sp.]|uniref:HD domain-containing protein n=1 Tax=Chromobacterium sp. TaxID=306190 RepID=UPI0035B0B73B